MRLSEIQETFNKELNDIYSLSEINILLQEVLNYSDVDPLQLRMDSSFDLEGQKLDRLIKALQDLKGGKPIQYIIGRVDFFGSSFLVDEHTLIPRPETEELVDLIQKDYSANLKGRILDIGTGSGCIALSLKSLYPKHEVIGVDVSEDALAMACENGYNQKLDADFYQIDFLKEWGDIEGTFDLIVSNPPYIKESESAEMSNQVLEYEPHLALFVKDEDPLIFYRRILDFIQQGLNPKGKVYLELNQQLGEETRTLFEKEGWSTKLIKDMSGNDRFLRIG
jgi:release factor glutamine methyltransferase